MIGCQTTDKKHKVNVKLTDHKERTCPLLCLVFSIPSSLPPSLCVYVRFLSVNLSSSTFLLRTFLFPGRRIVSFVALLPVSSLHTHYLTVIKHPITAGAPRTEAPGEHVRVNKCVCVFLLKKRTPSERASDPC